MKHDRYSLRSLTRAATDAALSVGGIGVVPTAAQRERISNAIEYERAIIQAAAVTGWSFESVSAFVARDAQRRNVPRLQAAQSLFHRAVYGFDLNTVPVAPDDGHDYGDMHQERRV